MLSAHHSPLSPGDLYDIFEEMTTETSLHSPSNYIYLCLALEFKP